MLSFEDARAKVIEIVSARVGACKTTDPSGNEIPATEMINLSREPAKALGRVLAEEIIADRNYPPFNRSIRDGFAVRSADATAPGAKLRVIGESRAGIAFNGAVGVGECVQILTGAPVPRGANAVIMLEHTRSEGDYVVLDQSVRPGQHFVLAGAEARVGEVVVPRGARLGYPELAMAAEVGHVCLEVGSKPRVSILSTGDELVPLGEKPGPFQIRNTNNVSLAAQVALAGGEPIFSGSAPDDLTQLRVRIESALDDANMLVLSGGVSAGKYDLVEQVLRELGAEIFFDAVAIRPGKPAVFGWCRAKPVFGLPGNPVSTMVTFELFVTPAIEVLSGYRPLPPPFFKAKLAHPIDEKGPVAHFLPARLTWPGNVPTVDIQLWEGSGDIGAVVRGNCFIVVHQSKPHLDAGEWVDVLPRRGAF